MERWATSPNVSVMRAYFADSDPPRPETHEYRVRLWIAKPDRIRQEAEDSTTVGRGERWWSWSSYGGFTSNEQEPDVRTGNTIESHAAHLDPAVLLPQIELEEIDLPRVDVRPRGGEHHLPGLPGGADRHRLTVDERGVVVRIESFVDGEPFLVSELLDPVWDEPIPDDVFTLELPEGEQLHSPSELHASNLTVEEGAARASFAVYAVGELPEGVWRTRISYRAAYREQHEELVILYHRHDGRGMIQLVEQDAAAPRRPAVPVGAAHVSAERGGTLVELQSTDYDEEVLQTLAETLVRV